MSKTPRVLIAASIYPPDPGGPALHASRQFEYFQSRGLKVKLVTLAHYRMWPRWIRHLLFSIVLFFKSFGTDIIYAHDAWGVGFIALVGAKLRGEKFVMRVGGDLAWEWAALKGQTFLSMKEWYERSEHTHDMFYKLTRFVLLRVDLLIVPADILKDVYTKYYGVKSEKVTIIQNPISGFQIAVNQPEPTILYASRLVAYKNLDFVLRVLAHIFPKHPELKFLIIGDGPERNRLEELTKTLKIQTQVVFKGTIPQAEVLDLTSRCLFTLAPALTEFNPNYVLQGLSLGKPFLVSRENGLAFAVPKELTFSARSEDELRDRMEFLLNPTHYTKAQEELAKSVIVTTWEDNLEQNIKAIKSLV